MLGRGFCFSKKAKTSKNAVFAGGAPRRTRTLLNGSEDIVSNFYNSNHPIGKMMYTTLNQIKGFSKHIINFNDNFDNSENLYKQLLFLPLSKNINEKTAKNIALFLNSVIDQKPKQINDKNEIKNFDGLFLW